jgi:hypothetical protein
VDDIAGLTVWNDSVAAREQVRAAGILHSITGNGTAWIQLANNASTSEEEIISILRFAWKETQISRLRFVKPLAQAQQLTAAWDEAGP